VLDDQVLQLRNLLRGSVLLLERFTDGHFHWFPFPSPT
jgi:hypothetical protein